MGEEQTSTSVKVNRKKWGITGTVLLILIALIAGIVIYNTPSNRLSRQLDLGNRYLEEQNYEQAIVEFDKAIAIDPMSAEAYLGKAEAYIGMGDMEMAIQTLQEGYDRTGSGILQERMEELQAEMEAAQRRQQEEEKDALKELVESEEYQENLWKLSWASARVGWIQHIPDEEIKELSRSYVATLERYRELYEENYRYWWRLSELYLILDEYEASMDMYEKADELWPNRGHDLTEALHDKYGRNYWYGSASDSTSKEYDGNEKLVKSISTVDNRTSTTIYEYDTEGRTVRQVQTDSDGSVYDTTTVYNQTGFTEYHNSSFPTGSNSSVAIECEFINEFGEYTAGEPYDM